MLKQNESLIQDIKKQIRNSKGIKAVIVFGSVAREEDKPNSDIDICVIVKEKNVSLEKNISNIFLDLEKKYQRNIQMIICGEGFEKVERQFLETILREGVLITGNLPPIPIQKLQLEPYSIIKYEMKDLPHSDKMRVNRLLYGKETRKEYKGKIYLSHKKGLVIKLRGIRTGKASVFLPEKESQRLEKELLELGVKTKKICAWLQKI